MSLFAQGLVYGAVIGGILGFCASSVLWLWILERREARMNRTPLDRYSMHQHRQGH